MKPFKFIHSADIHLDSPFKGLSYIPNHLLEEIKSSTLLSFSKIIDYCIELQVDFLILSGDIYDSADKSLKAQMHFLEGMKRLDAHGIHTYIIHGNHDPYDQINKKFQWPKSAHFFPADQVGSFSFSKKHMEFAHIYGRSFPTKSFKENIVGDYLVENKDLFNIGLLHTNLESDPNHELYAPCSLSDLKGSSIDYWALGHVHQKRIVSEKAPAIIYPGNTQGRHIHETGEKGCFLVEVTDKEIEAIQWLPTSTIIWESLDIDVSEIKTMDQLITFIQDKLHHYLELKQKPMITRIILSGRAPIYAELKKTGVLNDMKEIINQTYASLENWVYIQALDSKVKPSYSLDEIMNQESFIAYYLKTAAANKDENLSQESLLAELARNHTFRRHFSDLNMSVEDLEDIYEKAIQLALEFFVEEETK